MQARIIKGKNYTPPLQPIKKADTTTQVTEQEAFNAGDWIEPPYELAASGRISSTGFSLPSSSMVWSSFLTTAIM